MFRAHRLVARLLPSLAIVGLVIGASAVSRGANQGTLVADTRRERQPDSSCRVAIVSLPKGRGLTTYVSGARFPTALAWAPDGRLFIAELKGVIKIAWPGHVATFATVPTVTTQPDGSSSERGLLGLALSPTFEGDHFVYALYSSADRTSQIVIRWKECNNVPTAPTQLIALPAGPDCCHKGGRLAFGPDRKLYITIGDEDSVPVPPGGPTPPIPQQLADLRGKVLRYNGDGTVPVDNPFGHNSPVWAAGLRNPFGIAFSRRGAVFVTDNGPTNDAGSPLTGYDTAQLARAGGIYQWPRCYGYGLR